MRKVLRNLSKSNLYKIKKVIELIDDRLQLNDAATQTIQIPSALESEFADSLNYLKVEGAILRYEIKSAQSVYMNSTAFFEPGAPRLKHGFVACVEFDIPTFKTHKEKLNAAIGRSKKSLAKQKPSDNRATNNNPIYEIKFTESGVILLNERRLSRPRFDGVNGDVFGYIFKNRNKEITRDEIEQHCSEHNIPNLHKVVENLGFKGVYKKAFFAVSKGKIKFRNPLYAHDLKALGIKRLPLPPK